MVEIEKVIADSWNAYKKGWKKIGTYTFFIFIIIGILYLLTLLSFTISFYLGGIICLIYLFISLTLPAGLLHLYNLSFTKKKIKLKLLFDFISKNWIKILKVSILQFLIIACIFSPIFISLAFYYSTESLIYLFLVILFSFISFLISLFFVFPIYSFVIEKLSTINCIKRSVYIVKNNYFSLIVLYFAITLLALFSSIIVLPLFLLFVISIILIPFAIILIILYLFYFIIPLTYFIFISFYRNAIKRH
ncbi:MAG: hypothetical protein QXF15_01895 [Candidatus Aenigmatarchaeota archaeon]|nr:hypothetical protein [Candidatus Aenigmarchaeota archaeon]